MSGISIFVAICTAALVGVAPASAQDEDERLTLSLVSADVKPGTPVYVNAMYSNPDGVPVVEIRQSIQLPKENLVFVRARLGVAADAAGAELSLDMKDASGARVEHIEAARRLELKITAKRRLEDGALVELQFGLHKGTEQTIRLGHAAEAFDIEGKRVPGLAFGDAEIVVTEDINPAPPPVHGCFFYMH